jgi:hypothetical protein
MDRLDALRIKYARAQEHRAAWSRALDKWVATTPYGVRGEADPSGWFVSRLVAREPPPPELSLTFADMISNLRATLDHIIWALVEESGNATHDQLTFPCVLDARPTDFSLCAGTEGLAVCAGQQAEECPAAVDPAIEQAQPFTAHQPRRHPMYVLHRLDITTKHRLLIPIEPSIVEARGGRGRCCGSIRCSGWCTWSPNCPRARLHRPPARGRLTGGPGKPVG